MTFKGTFGRSAEFEAFERETRRVNVDFPEWTVQEMDEKARRLGISRQALLTVRASDCLRSENKMIQWSRATGRPDISLYPSRNMQKISLLPANIPSL